MTEDVELAPRQWTVRPFSRSPRRLSQTPATCAEPNRIEVTLGIDELERGALKAMKPAPVWKSIRLTEDRRDSLRCNFGASNRRGTEGPAKPQSAETSHPAG